MRNFLIILLTLSSILIVSCSKDVSLEPLPSADIIWKDTATIFLNPVSEFFQFTSSSSWFFKQSATKPVNEVLFITYVAKPITSSTFDLALYNSPIIIYYDKIQNEWESRTGIIEVVVNGSTVTAKFTNVTFRCLTSVKPDVIASGHITSK